MRPGGLAARGRDGLYCVMHPDGTFHTHTTWSDGTATVPEMVEAATAAGFRAIGLSDHFGLYPDGREVFGMRCTQFDGYVRDVLVARERSRIGVLLGLEWDYAPGSEALIGGYLARTPFDYVIGSVHFLDGFALDCSPEPWQLLPPDEVDDIWRRYWLAVGAVAASGLADAVGHLDLPKKFGFVPRTEPRREIAAALDAIKRAQIPVEMNTAGWDKPCRDAYPSEALLRECFARGIPVVVSDDAHGVGDLGRHFARAVGTLRRVGYREVLAFVGGRRTRAHAL
ncbi:MAG: Histidinol-phosphatase [Lentisphaerae bacterium ADurb.BinA184]|nr:MAG: Histidinol-phosphatase [Lentisphaerae bacterium ADurb.BinA184]